MRTHGLLFSAPMATANAEDRKTQTRRIASFPIVDADGQFADPENAWLDRSYESPDLGGCACLKMPYGPADHDLHTVQRIFPKWQTGDTIYQKETHFDATRYKHLPLFACLTGNIIYAADYAYRKDRPVSVIGEHHWTPSIFMPRASSRFTATITQVRVQRLQDITEEDAHSEGVVFHRVNQSQTSFPQYPEGYRESYRALWNHINLKPAPIYGPKDKTTGKRPIIAYTSHPWSIEDFHQSYPASCSQLSTINSQPLWLGKPLHIFSNPWLFALTYKRLP